MNFPRCIFISAFSLSTLCDYPHPSIQAFGLLRPILNSASGGRGKNQMMENERDATAYFPTFKCLVRGKTNHYLSCIFAGKQRKMSTNV